MTPDTCPHCGAPLIPLASSFVRFACGTRWGGWQLHPTQSPECARYVRVRISQLKRMADLIKERSDPWARVLAGIPPEYRMNGWRVRWLDRMLRLHSSLLREIGRLRGMA